MAGNKLAHAPEAAVSALGTAGEVISGVAGNVVDKVCSSCCQAAGISYCQSDTMHRHLHTAQALGGEHGLMFVRCGSLPAL